MSVMIRNLCKVSQNFGVLHTLSNNSPKNVFIQKIRRSNTDVANLLKSQRLKKKKESTEVLKWILMMIPVTSFSLGCWQVYRLQWKLQLIDIMQAKTNANPVNMPMDFEMLQQMEYMPVKVRGEFLHDKEFCIGPRALIENDELLSRSNSLVSDPKKNQGWLVVTPFKLEENGEIILVNRGWIPQSQKPKEKRLSSFIKGPVELVGVVRLTEKRPPFMPKNNPQKAAWYTRDLEQMSSHIGCSPVWLDARGVPDPPPGWPIPNQTRVNLRNEHLSYIVTWYSLCGLTGFMWHRYFIRKLPLL
ncbi:surfeit locus protein 1 [Galleria mellonella]|uniref:SURF1-like protein n=1 Tax=Galleria mellonella TaxID=7137 RepID=A0A6J1WY57_GALME|nr:surfeit locus protein 1 [Galleria mellonella]